jgi:lipid A 3-O-deacylase
MARFLIVLLSLFATPAMSADREWGLAFARGADSADTDVVRLTYRHPLKDNGAWWMPAQVQLGVGVWRVPDIRGTTRRFDLSATPVWRTEVPWGYAEAGIGLYLLSKTINNDDTRVPSSLEFGSHIGTGVRLGKDFSVGFAVQHLSNAGIKQPNGGINLYMVATSFTW